MPSYEDVQFYKSCPEALQRSSIASLFPRLREGLYHVTSMQGLQGIFDAGAIIPNDGRFSSRDPQSERSYGRYRQYISLFDFQTPPERQCIELINTWESFFFAYKPATIVIGINRKKLEPKLLPNDIEREQFQNKLVRIPSIEVWYPEPMPVSLFSRLIAIVPDADPFEPAYIDEFSPTDQRVAELERYVEAHKPTL
jgi:hypothetical protein